MAELDSYKQTFIVAVVLIACVSCGTVPPLVKPDRLLRMSDAELRNIDHTNLCRGYAKTKSKKIASAINDLGFMKEKDWEALSRGEFYVGMSECVLLIGYKSRQQCQITGTIRNKNGDFIRSWNCYSSFFSKQQFNIELRTVNGNVTLIREKPLKEQLPELLKLLG